jgi:hypothetical protein
LIVDGLFSIGILIKSVFSTPARQVTSPNVSPKKQKPFFRINYLFISLPDTPI